MRESSKQNRFNYINRLYNLTSSEADSINLNEMARNFKIGSQFINILKDHRYIVIYPNGKVKWIASDPPDLNMVDLLIKLEVQKMKSYPSQNKENPYARLSDTELIEKFLIIRKEMAKHNWVITCKRTIEEEL